MECQVRLVEYAADVLVCRRIIDFQPHLALFEIGIDYDISRRESITEPQRLVIKAMLAKSDASSKLRRTHNEIIAADVLRQKLECRNIQSPVFVQPHAIGHGSYAVDAKKRHRGQGRLTNKPAAVDKI